MPATRKASVTMDRAELVAEIHRLVTTQDMAYYEFNLGLVQSSSAHRSAGASTRIFKASREAAALARSNGTADAMTATVPMLADYQLDNFDGRHALTYMVEALRRCPQA
jgi:hypothetical protein